MRSKEAGILAGLLVAFAVLARWQWAYTMDDAFITWRYAKHFGDGHGAVWNLYDPQPAVEGFTSTLHFFVLAAWRFVTGLPMEPSAKLLGVLATLVLAVVAHRTAVARGFTGWSYFVAMSFLASPFLAFHAIAGLETTISVLLTFLTVWTAVRVLEGEALVWRVVGLGLVATLTRPDFGLIFLTLCAVMFWRRPHRRRELLIAVVVLYVLPGIAISSWRFALFQDVVPQAFHVKQSPGLNRVGIKYVGRFLLFAALPYAALIFARFETLRQERPSVFWAVGLSVTLPCLYFTTTLPLMGLWHRFLIIHLPSLTFAAAEAMRLRPRVSGVAKGVQVAGVAAGLAAVAAHLPIIDYNNDVAVKGMTVYREVARRLAPFAAQGRWLTYYDAGAIPFLSEFNMIDVVGLNTPFDRLGHPCDMKTDIVLREEKPEGEPNPCPALYDRIVTLPGVLAPPNFDDDIVVFARRDLAYKDELRAAFDDWPTSPIHVPDGFRAQYHLRTERYLME